MTAENVVFIASVTGWSEGQIRTIPLDRLKVFGVACNICNGRHDVYDMNIDDDITERYLTAMEMFDKINSELNNGEK